jgi:hypothetical protein
MNDKEADRLIDESLKIPVPEGLSARLEAYIDIHNAVSYECAYPEPRLIKIKEGNSYLLPGNNFLDFV